MAGIDTLKKALKMALANPSQAAGRLIDLCYARYNSCRTDRCCVTAIRNRRKPFFLVTDPQDKDAVSTSARRGHLHEHRDLGRLFRNPGVFLDIGANIGAYTLTYAARGWRVFALEASPHNCSLLRKSIHLNDFDITLCEEALYSHTGEIYFLQGGPYGHIVDQRQLQYFRQTEDRFGCDRYEFMGSEADYKRIPCICLDDYKETPLAAISHLDLIKMDIEGSEAAAIRGMRRFLEEVGWPPIFIEANMHCLCWQAETSKSLFKTVSEAGYRPYAFLAGGLQEYNPRRFPEVVCTDYLMLHDIPEHLRAHILPGAPGDRPEIRDFIVRELDRLCDGQEWLDDCAFVCYNLQDFPEYANLPEVLERLERISRSARERRNEYLLHVIDWFDRRTGRQA